MRRGTDALADALAYACLWVLLIPILWIAHKLGGGEVAATIITATVSYWFCRLWWA